MLFAIVLIYVAIMALRLSRVERGLRELIELAGMAARATPNRGEPAGAAGVGRATRRESSPA